MKIIKIMSKNKNKYLGIIQARMGSSRLPGKTLMEVNGVSMLEYMLKRIQRAKKIDKIVVATTIEKADDSIVALCQELKVDFFRGSKNDVLDRYYQCALKYPEFNKIIRMTGDCPLIDPELADEVINFYEKNNYDYVVDPIEGAFPDGMAVEVFDRDILYEAAANAKRKSEREHVTLYIFNNEKFTKGYYRESPGDFSSFRLTLDNPEDFEVIKFLIENSRPEDSYPKYISLLKEHPEIKKINSHIKPNEGAAKSLAEDQIIR